jgi:hypothetical protein
MNILRVKRIGLEFRGWPSSQFLKLGSTENRWGFREK